MNFKIRGIDVNLMIFKATGQNYFENWYALEIIWYSTKHTPETAFAVCVSIFLTFEFEFVASIVSFCIHLVSVLLLHFQMHIKCIFIYLIGTTVILCLTNFQYFYKYYIFFVNTNCYFLKCIIFWNKKKSTILQKIQ